MAINASAEIISDMKKTLQLTVTEIERIQENLNGAMRVTAGWNDQQGEEYHKLMKRIVQLTDSPKDTLEHAMPKLDRLVQILDRYNNVHF